MPLEDDAKVEPSESQEDSLEELRARVVELEKAKKASERKAAEYKDKLTRLQADMENLQKITKRQVEAVTKQASESLIVKLLPILDSLHKAEEIAHSGKELPAEEMAVGLAMLRKQLAEVLEAEGLTEIPAVGQTLDPELHEAVSYVETDDASENTVAEEIRKGYILNGKVIRASLVVVNRRKNSQDEPKKPENT
ncbi:MAG: nucleotide exchange factor GrpE [Candidatus Bathyarchaeia archaeon]|jgi:molecular chaperone GrpE